MKKVKIQYVENCHEKSQNIVMSKNFMKKVKI